MLFRLMDNLQPVYHSLAIPVVSKKMRQFFLLLLTSCLSLSTAFGKQTTREVAEIHLQPSLSWGGMEDDSEVLIAGISDFIVSSKNELIALDYIQCRIFFFNSSGTLLKSLGGKGKGPLEFLQPVSIGQIRDTLYVWDAGNARFQLLTSDGQYIKTLSPTSSIGYRSLAFRADGGFFCSSGGFRADSLVQVYDHNGRMTRLFGKLEGARVDYFNLTAIKTQIQKRSIPASENNRLILCTTSDQNLMVIHQALPIIKKFHPDGTQRFARRLSLQAFSQIRTRFFAANDTLGPFAFSPLEYWSDVAADDKGGVYLLLNHPARMSVYHYDKNGFLIERISGPADNIALIYYKDDQLWAFGRDSLKFYRFKLGHYPD